MNLLAILHRHEVDPGAFRDALGVSDEAFRLWGVGKRRMSPDLVKLAEAKFGIPRHELRPDLWDPPAPAASGEGA